MPGLSLRDTLPLPRCARPVIFPARLFLSVTCPTALAPPCADRDHKTHAAAVAPSQNSISINSIPILTYMQCNQGVTRGKFQCHHTATTRRTKQTTPPQIAAIVGESLKRQHANMTSAPASAAVA